MKKALAVILAAIMALAPVSAFAVQTADRFDVEKYVIRTAPDEGDIALIQQLFDTEPEFFIERIRELDPSADAETVKSKLVADGNAYTVQAAGGINLIYRTPEEELSGAMINNEHTWAVYLRDFGVTFSFGKNADGMVFLNAGINRDKTYKDAVGGSAKQDLSRENAKERLKAEKGDGSELLDLKVLGLGNKGTLEYVKTENNEYIIPYLSRPDFSEFKNGAIYDRHETVELLKKEYPPEYFEINDGEPRTGDGGVPAGGVAGAEPEAAVTDEVTADVAEPAAAAEEAAATGGEIDDAPATGSDEVVSLADDEESEPVDYTLLYVIIAIAVAVAAGAVAAAVIIAKRRKK